MLSRENALVKLDLDDCPKVERMTIRGKLKRAGYTVVRWVAVRRSPSGKGWHVKIEVRPRPRCPYEVVALQAICGSDPYREAMQMNRARGYHRAPPWMRRTWNVLYLSDRQRQRHINLRELA